MHQLFQLLEQHYYYRGQDIPDDIIIRKYERFDRDIRKSEEKIRYIPIIPIEERSQIVLSPDCVEQREDSSSFDLNVSVLSESGCIDGIELVKFTGTEETSINITCFNPDREIDKSVEKHINPIVFLDVDDLEEKYWESAKGKGEEIIRLSFLIKLK